MNKKYILIGIIIIVIFYFYNKTKNASNIPTSTIPIVSPPPGQDTITHTQASAQGANFSTSNGVLYATIHGKTYRVIN